MSTWRVAFARMLLLGWVALMHSTACRAFDLGSMQRLIAEQQVGSVERMLELLPVSLRSHYALVYDSRSLQSASLSEPRVVLYGDDARLVVTFNGQDAQRGHDAVEVMQFDAASNRFEFREFLFPGTPSRPQRATVSQANPDRCLLCHGHPGRPVWDAHPDWPGVYGQRYRTPLTPIEAAGLRSFLQSQPQHPRYRWLLGVAAFAQAVDVHPNRLVRYDALVEESPNARLSDLLSQLNARAIAAELADTPGFASLGYALLGTLRKDCGSVAELWPASAPQDIERFEQETQQRQLAQQQLKQARAQRSAGLGPAPPGPEAETLTAFRYVVEAGLGRSTQEWTLALEKDSFDFSAPNPVRQELDRLLRADLARHDPALQPLAALRDVGAEQKYCRHLRKHSVQRTAADRRPAHRADSESMAMRSPSRTLQDCAQCHRGELGPLLPFDQPGELAALLPVGQYPRGTLLEETLFRLSPEAGNEHMPRGQDLRPEEREALTEHLRTLAGHATPRQPCAAPTSCDRPDSGTP